MSNTEQMVSDNQREWLRTMADAIQHADGKPMPVDPIVAELLRALLAKPATQHQGDPVALPAKRPRRMDDQRDDAYDNGWNNCLDEIARLGPLYTHPAVQPSEPVAWVHPLYLKPGALGFEATVYRLTDTQVPLFTHPDAGEVERLHSRLREEQAYVSELAEQNTSLESERDTLRNELGEVKVCYDRKANKVSELEDKMAERDALLREANGLLKVSAGLLPRKHQTIRAHIDHLRSVVETALSASADPSEQVVDAGIPASVDPSESVERDELSEFEKVWSSTPILKENKRTIAEKFWQARATLECKP